MKRMKSFLAIVLSFSLYTTAFLNFTVQPTYARQQDSKIAVQRGYRTGYSDGYMSGYRDTIDNAAKNYDKHGEYAKADRAFNKDYGSLEDYRDGYRQGFEAGYDTGFEKRSFDATIPVDLNKRGVVAAAKTTATTVTVEERKSIVKPSPSRSRKRLTIRLCKTTATGKTQRKTSRKQNCRIKMNARSARSRSTILL